MKLRIGNFKGHFNLVPFVTGSISSTKDYIKVALKHDNNKFKK